MKLGSAERLREYISDHVSCWAINDGSVALLDSLPNEVESDVDVLSTSMEGGVFREDNSPLIIAEKSGGGVGKE